MTIVSDTERAWWKEAIVYQVYPRSFQDSNGDGIGDLPGLISRLDYLQMLGVDVIWLCPMYKSPNDDNGYDISDYRDIMEEFGTMADFDQLLAGLHARDMKIMIDLVVNHSSDEHRWFQESRKSKDNPYRDYYHWQPPKDGQVPNDWVSFFSGSAWDYDEATGEYYLHWFSKKQPDLNWENPKVREEVYALMRFWLDKGVSGFRMDVIPFISKKPGYPGFPADYSGDFMHEYATGPRLHEYLKEMHQEVLQHYDVMTVGEGPGVRPAEANDYVGKDRRELQMIFHFDYITIDRAKDNFFDARDWDWRELKKIIATWDQTLGDQGWNSIYFGNHDFPRMVSRFGHDSAYRVKSAKALATILFTLRGTPYIYQGDEIGMTNVPFGEIENYRDINTLNFYEEEKQKGGDLKAYLEGQARFSRDHARTPVQWSAEANAGFTQGSPWIMVHPNYTEINVAAALADPDSVWHYYRQMIKLRKSDEVLTYGAYEDLDPEHPAVYAYTRRGATGGYFFLLNMADQAVSYTLPATLQTYKLILLGGNTGTPPDLSDTLQLAPYDALIYQLQS